jgi:uncharacterized protein (TIGR02246 family)
MDERADIQRLIDRFLDRWNAEDVAGMAACWLETGDVVSTEGRLVRGRGPITELLGAERAGPLGGTRASMSLTSIRPLGPDVALLDADMEIVGGRVSAGGEALHMHVVMVAARREDAWWFEAVRPYALYSKATRSFGAPPTPTPTGETS